MSKLADPRDPLFVASGIVAEHCRSQLLRQQYNAYNAYVATKNSHLIIVLECLTTLRDAGSFQASWSALIWSDRAIEQAPGNIEADVLCTLEAIAGRL